MGLVKRLRYIAEQTAYDRRIAEFGPGGGNPKAKAQDHIEWTAADRIEELEAEVERLRRTNVIKHLEEELLECHAAIYRIGKEKRDAIAEVERLHELILTSTHSSSCALWLDGERCDCEFRDEISGNSSREE
jgi:hypothetical protein